MKCLHIITDLSIGGAEKALFNILNNGLNTKHDSHIISLMSNGALEQPIQAIGIPVITLGIRKGRLSLRAIYNLRKVVKKIQPDIIQGWMYHGNLTASIAAYLSPNTPVVAWNIRQTLYNLKNEKSMTRWVIRANRLFSRYPATIIYNSYLSRSQHEAFGYSADNGRTIPNGIDLQQFQPDLNIRETLRKKLGIPQSACVVGHIARFHAMKDHTNFLQAAASLAEKYQDVHFLMVGREIAKTNTNLAPLITDILSKRLHMLGECQNIERLLTAMDVFCTSSAWGEAFPNVLGEAMATGVPCVTTDVGDSARIVDETGLVVPPNNNVALTQGLQRMLTMPKEEKLALGQAARQRIISNYSIDSIVAKYAALYEELLNKKC